MSASILTRLPQTCGSTLSSPAVPCSGIRCRHSYHLHLSPCRHHAQRHKKTGEALTDENGNPLPLTSHTLAPVPVAIGGAGLPASVVFSKELPNAGLGTASAWDALLFASTCRKLEWNC